MIYTSEVLADMLEAHLKWQRSEEGGKRFQVEVGANLRGANLEGANLRGASLEGANLEGASLRAASLRAASLRGANLRAASLRGANLRGASLRGASLEGANLEGANLRGANLRGAKIDRQSHELLSVILLRAAEKNIQKRMIAGLILVSKDWCWNEFLAIESELREWALNEFAAWVQDDDNAPGLLRERAAKAKKPVVEGEVV